MVESCQKPETFQSWEEIFPNKEERDRQFENFLQGQRYEYSSNHTLAKEITITDPKTGARKTTFFRTFGGFASTTLLQNGDVEIEFVYEYRHAYTITPDVGNKNHNWTYEEIQSIKERLGAQIAKDGTRKKVPGNHKIASMLFYLKGKPAYKDWETTMRYNNLEPIRIGFRIYPKEILDKAEKFLTDSEL